MEVTAKHTGTGYISPCIIEAMKIYANNKLEKAAEVAMVNITTAYSQSREMDTKTFKKHTDSFPGVVKTVWINTESILDLKDIIL